MEIILPALVAVAWIWFRDDRTARRKRALHRLGCLPNYISGPFRR